MENTTFLPGEILLPAPDVDLPRWSVIACDQFTSESAYWDNLDRLVGKSPSTLRMIFPEAYLGIRPLEAERRRIHTAMARYLEQGVVCAAPGNAYIYVERETSSGLRAGLVGLLDLEDYAYDAQAETKVRSTEGTVPERLPPRVAIREGAPLELPHVMLFLDDPEGTVIEPLAGRSAAEAVYDFDLIHGGGHIRGWRISGAEAKAVSRAIGALGEPEVLAKKYGAAPAHPVLFAVGDGNHSLAAAKAYWEKLKKSLPAAELAGHPARYSLVELVNIHEAAVTFEPIHRVLFSTQSAGFLEELEALCRRLERSGGTVHTLKGISQGKSRVLTATGLTLGEVIGAVEAFCQEYIQVHGGTLDYIHGDEAAAALAERPGCAGVLLPAMDKGELFPSILRSGPFPRKSFSVGEPQDKRYYLESRRIQK